MQRISLAVAELHSRADRCCCVPFVARPDNPAAYRGMNE